MLRKADTFTCYQHDTSGFAVIDARKRCSPFGFSRYTWEPQVLTMKPSGWFSSLFKRQPPLRVRHTLFGELVFSRHDGWINEEFELWGFKSVELLLDAREDGPSVEQERAFRRFEQQRETLLPRCLAEVDKVRAELAVPLSTFVISGLTIPPLSADPHEHLWTLWFDLVGDEHFMYGVQTDDDWTTLTGFADD